VVSNVTVTGFTVRGFTGSGIGAIAARGTPRGQLATDNREGGIAAIVSTGTRMRFNRASAGDAAAFSVVLSPTADATRVGYVAQRSRVRHPHERRPARQDRRQLGAGQLRWSPRRGCAGAAGEFGIAANRIRSTMRASPANADVPALSGAGVAVFGARDNTIVGNLITG
jgi:hypothetical protein